MIIHFFPLRLNPGYQIRFTALFPKMLIHKIDNMDDHTVNNSENIL